MAPTEKTSSPRRKSYASPKKRTTKRFEGALLVPIERPSAASLKEVAKSDLHDFLRVSQTANEHVQDQIAERLVALAKHYSVSGALPLSDQLLRVLCHVAYDFIPGFWFTDELSRGRPPAPNPLRGPDLVKAVDDQKTTTNGDVAPACDRLTTQPGRWRGQNPRSLETAYYAERRRMEELEANPLYQKLRRALRDED